MAQWEVESESRKKSQGKLLLYLLGISLHPRRGAAVELSCSRAFIGSGFLEDRVLVSGIKSGPSNRVNSPISIFPQGCGDVRAHGIPA